MVFSRHAGHHVSGFGGQLARHVFSAGHKADEMNRESQLGNGLKDRTNRCSTAHIKFHFVHGAGRLERDTAGVEGNAFADQSNRFFLFFAAVVFEYKPIGGAL